MPIGTLTSKGQTTIPREVRDFLKLRPGDKLEFKLNPDGKTVILQAANIHVSSLRGILKSEGMKPYNSNERSLALRKRAHKK
jgi:antitoxin PrlF